MENYENIKAYIKSGIKEPMRQRDLVVTSILLSVLGVISANAGLSYNTITEVSNLIVWILSIMFVVLGICLTKNLNIKKYIRFYSILSVFSILIFTMVSYIFVIINNTLYGEFVCGLPLLVALITVARTYIQIKKGVKVQYIKLKFEFGVAVSFLGVLCARSLGANTSLNDFLNENAEYLILLIACCLAMQASNFVKLYYIERMKKQGISIE